MKFSHIIIVVICLLTILFWGCETLPIKRYWDENENRFNTNDLSRAQKETPFEILLPIYLPDNNTEKTLPDIEGQLKQFQNENNVEIIIRYSLDIGNKLPGVVIITERNFSSGEAELDAGEEITVIEGIPIVKTKDNWGSGFDAYYRFNSDGIYYYLETHYLPNEKSFKIVESMIKR